MPIDNVVEDELIETAWGNDVADTVNAVEALGLDHSSRHDSGGADALAADAAAGTPSLRSLGTTATKAAAGNHGHAHSDLTSVTANQHHNENHASRHLAAGADPLAIPTPDIQVFTADGTWTKPAGARIVRVRAVGGGGGGGGAGSTSGTQGATGGGGGGGAYVEKTYPATDLDATEAVVVGAGGTAGAATPTAGGTGGTSSFADGADLISAAGGSGGGSGAASTASTIVGGTGGTASGGQLNVGGSAGGSGINTASAAATAGFGGSTMLGGMQRPGATASVAGLTGKDYGGGGSGGRNAPSQGAGVAGGVGAPGIVIVETWF